MNKQLINMNVLDIILYYFHALYINELIGDNYE